MKTGRRLTGHARLVGDIPCTWEAVYAGEFQEMQAFTHSLNQVHDTQPNAILLGQTITALMLMC